MYTIEMAAKKLGEVLNLPVTSTDFKPAIGGTGYLDTWRKHEVGDCVIFGKDKHDRSFIVFPHPDGDGYVCIFQRYTSEPYTWVCTSSDVPGQPLDKQVARIEEFLKNNCELAVPGCSVPNRLYSQGYQD
jgi:hypothetical protein